MDERHVLREVMDRIDAVMVKLEELEALIRGPERRMRGDDADDT